MFLICKLSLQAGMKHLMVHKYVLGLRFSRIVQLYMEIVTNRTCTFTDMQQISKGHWQSPVGRGFNGPAQMAQTWRTQDNCIILATL